MHEGHLLVDGHNDHVDKKEDRGEPLRLMSVNRRYHSDGPRLLRGGVTATFFMVGGEELRRSLVMIEKVLAEVEQHPDSLLLVTSARGIATARRTGRLGVMLSWESCAALAGRLEILHMAYRLGVRASTLTHGEGGGKCALQGTASFFGYCTPTERASLHRASQGLTRFGREVIGEMNRLGMLVDVAHANDAATYDIVETSAKPVVSTHGGVFACCPHSRCSTDDQIRAIASTGGLQSIAFYRGFIAEPNGKPTIDGIVDQIEYVADLVGIDHVGIGSDFDGISDGSLPVIRSADQLPRLAEAMRRRGFTEPGIRKVWGENYVRVLKATIA